MCRLIAVLIVVTFVMVNLTRVGMWWYCCIICLCNEAQMLGYASELVFCNLHVYRVIQSTLMSYSLDKTKSHVLCRNYFLTVSETVISRSFISTFETCKICLNTKNLQNAMSLCSPSVLAKYMLNCTYHISQ